MKFEEGMIIKCMDYEYWGLFIIVKMHNGKAELFQLNANIINTWYLNPGYYRWVIMK